MTLQILLSWPPKQLSPNARPHYMTKHRVKKSYRHECFMSAIKVGAKEWGLRIGSFDNLNVHLEFIPPDLHRRDDDNLIASMKAGLDGIADALGIDDRHFRLSYECARPPAKIVGGCVMVTVSREQAGRVE